MRRLTIFWGDSAGLRLGLSPRRVSSLQSRSWAQTQVPAEGSLPSSQTAVVTLRSLAAVAATFGLAVEGFVPVGCCPPKCSGGVLLLWMEHLSSWRHKGLGPNTPQVEMCTHGGPPTLRAPTTRTERGLPPLGRGRPATTAAKIANRRRRCRWKKRKKERWTPSWRCSKSSRGTSGFC